MCEHPKLMSVNCVVKCAVCGAVVQERPTGADAPPPHCDREAFGETPKKRRTRKKGGSEA